MNSFFASCWRQTLSGAVCDAALVLMEIQTLFWRLSCSCEADRTNVDLSANFQCQSLFSGSLAEVDLILNLINSFDKITSN